MRKALNIPLEEFLRPFFGPGDTICLRIFDDRKTGTFKGAKLETTLSGIPALMDTLHKHNAQNRGIYFVVNSGGHEDGEIARINAQFMECDELSMEEQLKQIEALTTSSTSVSDISFFKVSNCFFLSLPTVYCQCVGRMGKSS